MKKNKNKNSTLSLDETKKKKKSSLSEEDLQGIDIVQRNREELKDERDKRINSKFERNASGQMIEAPQVRYKISGKACYCYYCWCCYCCCYCYRCCYCLAAL